MTEFLYPFPIYEIINFYMQMIVARGGEDKWCKVYAFSTQPSRITAIPV